VYKMATGGRLVPVTDPSSLFLAERVDVEDRVGCAVSLMVEGLRPMAVEVQALVSRAEDGVVKGRCRGLPTSD